jgi:hypothetical protein
MGKHTGRRVLATERLEIGPRSDAFCAALAHVLGGADLYAQLIGWSGRGFKICWSHEKFCRADEDPDPEAYLRQDYESGRAAVEAAGYGSQFLGNGDCRHPVPVGDAGRMTTSDEVRDLALAGVDSGRPVLALLSASSTRWAPEWSLVTGYDEGGEVAIGWSCFQDEEPAASELDFEPEGPFRKREWEKDTVAVLRILGDEPAARDDRSLARQVLAHGVSLSRCPRPPEEAYGFRAYDAWTRSIEEPSNQTAGNDVLLRRLDYHRHWIGHLAAQKWYTSVCLRGLELSPWCVADVFQAAACYARIHELMWECWSLAAAYWRDTAAELPRFRDADTRKGIVAIIREAKSLDLSAVDHLDAALAAWEKTHRQYLDS